MIEIKGKYETAKIFTDNVEQGAIKQIMDFVNHPVSKNSHVRIMPDVHQGKGCVIGYTAKLTDIIIPSLIGLDVGCGVIGWNLGKNLPINSVFFQNLDLFIREKCTFGNNINDSFLSNEYDCSKSFSHLYIGMPDIDFLKSFSDGIIYEDITNSMGSLGGGNHFLELDKDTEGNIWLVIHSGSRKIGNKVAQHFIKKAKENCLKKENFNLKKEIEEIKKKFKGKDIENEIKKIKPEKYKVNDMEYLSSKDISNYKECLKILQTFAKFNRMMLGYRILNYFGEKYCYHLNNFAIDSVHNYIDFENNIIRKGAISAKKNESVLIPLNMLNGTLIGIGKGNEDWNFSAPHGAGRVFSRGEAKKKVSLEAYKEIMHNAKIWSSCINKNTLDKSPFAYKDHNEIIKNIEPTVTVTDHLKPIYVFKAN